MTLDDLLRFQFLCRQPHLWPEEVAEAKALAKGLGVEIVIRHEKLSEWDEPPTVSETCGSAQ